jgi:hypothetical protein
MSEVAITPLLDVTAFRSMGSAVSRRVLVQPENLSSLSLGTATQDVYFALPSGRYSMINGQNSYLMFDATVTIPTDTELGGFSNGSASSAIRGLELIIGNQSVELLDRYNNFAACVEDFQSKSRALTMDSIVSGNSASFVKCPGYAATAADQAQPVRRYVVPIYSSVLGTLATQVCPAVDGIRLKLTFETLSIATQATNSGGSTAGTAAIAACSITNINLVMDYLDVDPVIHSQLIQESGGVFKTHGTGVANFQTTIASAAASSASILIPARYSSVKSYITSFRNALTTSGTAGIYNSFARYNPAIRNFTYRIDGRQYPSVPIVGHNGTVNLAGEVFMELIKCFDAANAVSFDCVFNLTQYISTGSLNTTATVPLAADSYLIGVDFEEAVGGGKAVVSGKDTNSNNTFLECQFNSSAVMPAMLIDTYALYDNILECNMMTGEVSVSK